MSIWPLYCFSISIPFCCRHFCIRSQTLLPFIIRRVYLLHDVSAHFAVIVLCGWSYDILSEYDSSMSLDTRGYSSSNPSLLSSTSMSSSTPAMRGERMSGDWRNEERQKNSNLLNFTEGRRPLRFAGCGRRTLLRT